MILRLAVLAMVALSCCIAQDSDFDHLIDEIFAEQRPPGSACDILQGELAEGREPGCFECYSCDGDALKSQAPSRIRRLTMNTDRCDKSAELCCVSQAVLVGNRIGGECGVANPDGEPRALRTDPKQLLPAQLPWTAALFRGSQLLCGAALMSERTLLSTARCARSGGAREALHVRLGPAGADHTAELRVERVVVHEQYKPRSGHNDIALLSLTIDAQRRMPAWAAPACLPLAAPRAATPCVAAAAGSTRLTVYSRVLRSEACAAALRGGGRSVVLHSSQLCSMSVAMEAPLVDHAAPLVCQDAGSGEYTLYGLASFRGDLRANVQLYTNVADFRDWLKDNLQELE